MQKRTRTNFLIREINLSNTSFKGFNLTGLGAFFTSGSTTKAGPLLAFDRLIPFIGLPALRGGKTSLRPVR
jgi:hypothetical protein